MQVLGELIVSGLGKRMLVGFYRAGWVRSPDSALPAVCRAWQEVWLEG